MLQHRAHVGINNLFPCSWHHRLNTFHPCIHISCLLLALNCKACSCHPEMPPLTFCCLPGPFFFGSFSCTDLSFPRWWAFQLKIAHILISLAARTVHPDLGCFPSALLTVAVWLLLLVVAVVVAVRQKIGRIPRPRLSDRWILAHLFLYAGPTFDSTDLLLCTS